MSYMNDMNDMNNMNKADFADEAVSVRFTNGVAIDENGIAYVWNEVCRQFIDQRTGEVTDIEEINSDGTIVSLRHQSKKVSR